MRGRVLLIGPMPPPITGNALAFKALANHFDAIGVRSQILNISPRYQWTAKIRSYKVRRAVDYLLLAPAALFAIMAGRGVVYLTVAQSWSGFLRDMAFIWLSRLVLRPVVLHIHGGNYDCFLSSLGRTRRRVVLVTLSLASRIILLSNRLTYMLDIDPRLQNAIRIIPNGVPIDLSEHCKVHRDPTFKPFRVLYLSNLIESKGYLVLIRAAGLLRKQYAAVDFEFVLAGRVMTNPEDDIEVAGEKHANDLIESIIAELDIASCVHFPGVVGGHAKRDLLASSDVLVLPTRYNNEGQPLCILEAMEAGLPVIATNYRAIPDMVIPGNTGLFVPADDPESLADAIACLFFDRDLYNRMSLGARRLVREQFDIANHLDAVHRLIVECE